MSQQLLIDTHIFLWLMFKDNNLKPKDLKIINEFAKNNALLISAISIWEIALLEKRRRIHLYQPITTWMETALGSPGLSLAPLTPPILCESVALPEAFHKDPADRMIVATARTLRAHLLTYDEKILEYARQGLIDCI